MNRQRRRRQPPNKYSQAADSSKRQRQSTGRLQEPSRQAFRADRPEVVNMTFEGESDTTLHNEQEPTYSGRSQASTVRTQTRQNSGQKRQNPVQTRQTPNLSKAHGPVINIVSEADEPRSLSRVDQGFNERSDQRRPDSHDTGRTVRMMPVSEASTRSNPSSGGTATDSMNQRESGPSQTSQTSVAGSISGSQTQENGMFSFSNEHPSVTVNNKLQDPQPPELMTSIFDPVSSNVSMKMKEKIWNGEFIDLGSLLKSNQSMANDLDIEGELTIKGGSISIMPKKASSINNIHVWTSAFIIYASVLLEKWPEKGAEYFKYMQIVRLAASRGCSGGWILYDEQYRLRKSRSPTTSWGVVDGELWMLCVTTPNNSSYGNYSSQNQSNNSAYSNYGTQNQSNNSAYGNFNNQSQGVGGNNRFTQQGKNAKQSHKLYCRLFNRGLVCNFGKLCKFLHKCQKCNGNHPASRCMYH